MHISPQVNCSAVRDADKGFGSKKPEPDPLRAPANKKCTILLVDDEPVALRINERALESSGREFKKAADGVEALALFGNGHGSIDLVISDYDMPNMNGLELLKKARALDPDTQFIVLTGDNSPERETTLLRAGAFAVYSKPVDINELRDIVDLVLGTGVPKG
jgi:CheY-like chemotaxis protein